MRQALTFIVVVMTSLPVFAEDLFKSKIHESRLYDIFLKEGVPEPALKRSFQFLNLHRNKHIKVKAKIRTFKRSQMGTRALKINKDHLAIIDYTKPSKEKRLYILNLKKGTVSRHLVAHGKGSGSDIATKFSNEEGSLMSSLGFYLVGNTYWGQHGETLNLYGLDPFNDQAAERNIVMHAASYVSEDFIKTSGRLGRSWGCPAVSQDVMDQIIKLLQDGGLIYAYHEELDRKELTQPILQAADDNVPDDIPVPVLKDNKIGPPLPVLPEQSNLLD